MTWTMIPCAPLPCLLLILTKYDLTLPALIAANHLTIVVGWYRGTLSFEKEEEKKFKHSENHVI